jgi:hypothetical protein
MKSIKWFTQRITLIIVVPTVLLVIPFVLTKAGQLVGLWALIDKLYPATALYWFVLVITRWAFAFAWYKLGELFSLWGERSGFFWYEPDNTYRSNKPVPVDKSGKILNWIGIAIVAAALAEFAIRLSIWERPIYLPPG